VALGIHQLVPAAMYRSPIPEPLWQRIRDEFNLPTLEQVRERLSAVHEDPEPVMRQLVRVIDEGTYCPGFQFCPDLSPNPVVVGLFERAMELRIPHNYFALWMMVPCAGLQGARPVDLREGGSASPLLAALERTFAGPA
jgi:hypothetical protein